MREYLDPEIAGEGESANNWAPGVWTNTPSTSEDEYQPDIDPPHINDYAAFKKHKHYRQYFRAYRYVAFPAWVYHPTLEAKIVKSVEEVQKLGAEWSPTPPNIKRIEMAGKSLPVKNDTQRLAETIAASLPSRQGSAQIDPTTIAAIVAAVMAALPQPGKTADPSPDAMMPVKEADDVIERTALLELAEKEGVKVDGRWSNKRLKEALGL